MSSNIGSGIEYYTGIFTDKSYICLNDTCVDISNAEFHKSLTVYGPIYEKLALRNVNIKTHFQIGIASPYDDVKLEKIKTVELTSVTVKNGIHTECPVYELLINGCTVDGITYIDESLNTCTITDSIFNGDFTCTCSDIKILKCKINGNLNINMYEIDRNFKNSIYIFDCQIDELTITGDCDNLEIRESEIKSLILNSEIKQIKVKITNCDECKFPKKQDCQKDTLENGMLSITQN